MCELNGGKKSCTLWVIAIGMSDSLHVQRRPDRPTPEDQGWGLRLRRVPWVTAMSSMTRMLTDLVPTAPNQQPKHLITNNVQPTSRVSTRTAP